MRAWRWRVTHRDGGWWALLEPVAARREDLIYAREVRFPTWRAAFDYAYLESARMWPWWP